MWVVAVILIVALLLAVAMAPKPNLENARAAQLGDFQVPRAKYGDPVGLLWGTVRAKSPVAGWYGDLVATPMKQKVPNGLFSSKKVIVGYKYNIGLDLFWCLGGRAGNTVTLKRLWAGKHVIWSGNMSTDSTININLPNLFGGDKERGGLQGVIAFYNGGFNPAQDPYLLSKCDPNVPAYNGFCRTVFRAFYVGTQTSIESFSAELSRMTSNLSGTYSIMPNGLDVNPMEVLYDAITEKWGRFGAVPDDIDIPSWTTAAQVLYNENNGMSLFVQSSITGKQLAEEVLRQADGVLFQDPATAKIKMVLIRQDYDIDTLTVLDDSIVTELREFSKTTWESALNQCRVTFRDRASDYEDSSALAQDFALINYQQRVKGTDMSFPGVYNKVLANEIAARQLSFMNVPLFKVELACNRKASNLRPGMVVKFNWAPYGLSNLVLRVLKVDLGELEDGTVRLSCIQDRFSTGTPVFAPPSNSGWTPPTVDPSIIATRRVFEPPYFFARGLSVDGSVTDGRTSLYTVANKPSTASQSYDAQVSLDTGVSWADVGSNQVYNGSGTLQALYPATAGASTGFDATGFTVTGATGTENLASYTLANARDGRALLLIDEEWMLYTTVSVGANVVFTNIYRGLFDSAIVDHAAGARVWFVSEMDGLLEQSFAAGTPQVRLLDNAPNGQLDPVSVAVPVDTVTLSNPLRPARPYPPDYVQLNGSRTPAPTTGATSVSVSWRERNRKKAEISVYNDSSDLQEAGVTYTMRWRVGAGSYTTVTGLTGTSTTIPVTGLTGTLEVRLNSVLNGVSSLTDDALTMVLG